MHSDFVSHNGETADDIINQHLIEEEQSLRTNHMESKYKDPPKNRSIEDNDDIDMYDDDPEFEKIANNDEDKDKEDEMDYIDDSLNFN